MQEDICVLLVTCGVDALDLREHAWGQEIVAGKKEHQSPLLSFGHWAVSFFVRSGIPDGLVQKPFSPER
jgi:hypothetical protein